MLRQRLDGSCEDGDGRVSKGGGRRREDEGVVYMRGRPKTWIRIFISIVCYIDAVLCTSDICSWRLCTCFSPILRSTCI